MTKISQGLLVEPSPIIPRIVNESGGPRTRVEVDVKLETSFTLKYMFRFEPLAITPVTWYVYTAPLIAKPEPLPESAVGSALLRPSSKIMPIATACGKSLIPPASVASSA